MDGLKSESLFSLEIVVDKLKVEDVVCRFPSVAFRLLDFSTIMIYHVEMVDSDKIRTKLTADPSRFIPAQLTELQDKDGYYLFKKGKSCLFRTSAETLHEHLSNTPLYIMIVDVYPEVPKLVGNCTIPLDYTMKHLYNDIVKMGINTPSVEGNKGRYPLFNLMGAQIGWIYLGFRLLSLGQGLLEHIPQKSVPKLGTDHKITLESTATLDKDIQVSLQKDVISQTTQKSETVTNGTQTQRKRRHKKQPILDIEGDIGHNEDDVIITNTVCPPALYFHNDRDNALEHDMYLMGKIKAAEKGDLTASNYPNHDGYHSDDSTIREEDVYSDSDELLLENYKKSKTAQTEHRLVNLAKSDKRRELKICEDDKPNEAARNGGNFRSFPLLNQLLQEIQRLQGPLPAASENVSPDLSPQQQHFPSNVPVLPKQEPRSSFLARLATPRSGRSDYARKGHRECLNPPVGKTAHQFRAQPARLTERKRREEADKKHTQERRAGMKAKYGYQTEDLQERPVSPGRKPIPTPRASISHFSNREVIPHPTTMETEMNIPKFESQSSYSSANSRLSLANLSQDVTEDEEFASPRGGPDLQDLKNTAESGSTTANDGKQHIELMGVDPSEFLQLKRMVDVYSEEDEKESREGESENELDSGRSYRSVRSTISDASSSRHKGRTVTIPGPTLSSKSPTTAVPIGSMTMATTTELREPVDDSSESPVSPLKSAQRELTESAGSTAVFRRSEVEEVPSISPSPRPMRGFHGASIDPAESPPVSPRRKNTPRSPRKPFPSPRRQMPRRSLHTESISSFEPSDEESVEEYTDAFEAISENSVILD